MKKTFLALVLALAALLAVGCGADTPKQDNLGTEKHPLTVGVTPGPHAEIMDVVKKVAEKKGLYIKVVEFSDYVTPNMALQNGEIDVNSYQHEPYLKNFNAGQGNQLVKVADTVLYPISVYSKKLTSLDQLPEGGKISIPNDPTNGGRALLVLQSAGLIKLNPQAGITATVADIVENPKHLEIRELDAAQVPRSLSDVDAAVINTNYALEAGLNPSKDALYTEQKDSPYVNILAVKKGNEKLPAVEKLIEAYHSDEVRKFVEKRFEGAVSVGF